MISKLLWAGAVGVVALGVLAYVALLLIMLLGLWLVPSPTGSAS